VAAPAETRTPNLHRAKTSLIKACGWKGGDSGGSAGEQLCGTKKRKNRLDSDRPSHGRRLHSLTRFPRLFRDETLPALRTFDPIKVDAANPIRRNSAPALRADSVEGCLNSFGIDFLLPGAARDCLTIQAPGKRKGESTNPSARSGTGELSTAHRSRQRRVK
jgi:hypothetical protein